MRGKWFNRTELVAWCEKCQISDITYHRKRSELWKALTKLILRNDGDDEKDPKTVQKVEGSQLTAIKSALCCRNGALTDDKTLAFDTAVDEILEAFDDYLEAEAEDQDNMPLVDQKQKIEPSGGKFSSHKAQGVIQI
jgi:hypothetical protein